jgi:signal peptidase I
MREWKRLTFEHLKKFFLPRFDRRYLLRVLLVTAIAFVIFGYILPPFYVRGDSMLPTYETGDITLGWRLAYAFSEPERGDIVIIRLAGHRISLLKRIVALPGETVAFKEGDLFINGKKLYEPYILKPCDWNLAPRRVDAGHYYVIGDNRSTSMEKHVFGQVEKERIIGVPLW